MFTFLNSAILIGLVAVALPVLIHLFTRQKIKTVYFSSLKFLKELQKQQIRKLKIRQILLLILRTLVILFLVLAFARPTLKKTRSSALETGAQISAVIVLDNTLSMGREVQGTRLIDEAKERALKVLDYLRPGDEMYLLYPQHPPVFAHEGPRFSLETMSDLIKNTRLSYRTTDYYNALLLANKVLSESHNINREIYLIGDLQKNGLVISQNNHTGAIQSENTHLFVLPVDGRKSENLNITRVQLASQILEKGKVVEIEVSIRNNSDVPQKNKLVHLFVNGKRVGQNVVNLEPHSETTILFRMVPDRAGMQTGYVLLEDDDLLEDNRRYFTFRILDKIKILLAGNRPQDTHFIRLALQPAKDHTSYMKITRINAEQLPSQNFSDFQVVILANVPQLDNTTILKLQRFVAEGGGLMVFLGDNVDLRNYNELVQKKLNLPLLSEVHGGIRKDQFYTIDKVDFSHPIFYGVFENKKRQFISPHIQRYVQIKSGKPVDKIMEYGNGEPFLFESKYKQGRIMYFTTSIAPEWSDLVFKGIFVPTIYRGVVYLAGGTSEEKTEFLIGDEIVYQPEKNLRGSEFILEKPDGRQTKIKPEISQGTYLLRIEETDLPGIYKLFVGSQLINQWAVNYNSQELKTEKFEIDTLSEVLPEVQITKIDNIEEIPDKLTESRFGQELWKYFVALALILMIGEMLLIKEKQNVEAQSGGV